MNKENSPAHVRSSTRTVLRSRGGISAEGRSPCTKKCSQKIKYIRRRWQSREFKRRGDTSNTTCRTQAHKKVAAVRFAVLGLVQQHTHTRRGQQQCQRGDDGGHPSRLGCKYSVTMNTRDDGKVQQAPHSHSMRARQGRA